MNWVVFVSFSSSTEQEYLKRSGMDSAYCYLMQSLSSRETVWQEQQKEQHGAITDTEIPFNYESSLLNLYYSLRHEF